VQLRRVRRTWKRLRRSHRNERDPAFRDFDTADREIIRRVSPHTQTSWQKLHGLMRATEYIARNDVPGAIVECGVWRGGSMMAVHLFDTFSGMVEPGDRDVDHRGRSARETWVRLAHPDDGSEWCRAGLAEVRSAMASLPYPQDRIHYVVGRVEDTIPENAPEQIALLRLDTDWYDSTKHELDHLYPRLAVGGVLLIDDYGSWRGCRMAVDEYLAENKVPLLLSRLDAGARIGVKLR
jgi:hypothetical protein